MAKWNTWGLNDDGDAAARRFHERVHSPVLTDVSVDWGGLPVSEVYPKRIPDVFSAKPVVITGRYTGAARGSIKLRGRMAGREFERVINVNLPASEPHNDVLATLWARTKVEDLMSQDWLGTYRNTPRQPDLRDAIQQLGLNYRLMTQYTSFVAVEETTIVEGGKPRIIDVPVEMPEGVSYEGIYGRGDAQPMPARRHDGQACVSRPCVPVDLSPRRPWRWKRPPCPRRAKTRPAGPAAKIAPKLAAAEDRHCFGADLDHRYDTCHARQTEGTRCGCDRAAEVAEDPSSRAWRRRNCRALAAFTEVTYITPLA